MKSFRLGSVWGVELRVHSSWFIILVLILWTFTAGAFPAYYPDLRPLQYFGMGLAATLLFFGSLLMHELAHSLVARRRGLSVEGITLFVFGGLAGLGGEPKTARHELEIAIAGPLTSLAIAGAAALVAVVGASADWGIVVVGVARLIAVVNVALAVFNLLPGLPLDGGRILRGVVWWITGDQDRATRWAAGSGRAIAWLLILVGLFQVLLGNLLGGMWLAFIGWFVRVAAEASVSRATMRRALENVRAADIIAREPEFAPAELTLGELVARSAWRGRHRTYPVVRDGELIGVITLDQLKALAPENWQLRTVQEEMRPLDPSHVVDPDEPVVDLLDRLIGPGDPRLVVARSGTVHGIITGADLSRWLEWAEVARRN